MENKEKMKAIVCTKYGPPEVLELRDVEKPVPKDNEVLIKIHATTVTSSDCIVRSFDLPLWHPMGLMMGMMLGFGKPRNSILGLVLTGEVESVGKDVKKFKKGDQVSATTIKSMTKIRFGAYAQYTCLPEDWMVVKKPTNVTYEEAAAVPYGAWLALHFLRKGNIQNRKKVLIYGASGSVGTSAVQLAKHFGAEVTGICSTTNLEMVKSLGTDKVIDYKKEDFTKRADRYDLILDSVPMPMANRKSLKLQCKKALTPDGKYISIDDGSPKSRIEDFIFIKELVESGKLRPVIDRTYPLEQMVEAHRYVDKGHKKGNVIISVKHNNKKKQ
jgi:NADPH:quinone reductase-like Zn-dependent oxidoreductase